MRRITLTLLSLTALLLLSVSVIIAQPNTQQATPEAAATSSLKISQVLPADNGTGIEPDSTITVIFNLPVVPLTVAEDSSTLPQPLTFTPAVQGKGEWLNTSIYVFHPDPALQGGTKYSVTVERQPDGGRWFGAGAAVLVVVHDCRACH